MTHVCFICSGGTVLSGHRVCARHHDPRRCPRENCASSRGPTRPIAAARFKHVIIDALNRLGRSATSAELAAETGLTATQIAASCRAAKEIEADATGGTSKPTKGRWRLIVMDSGKPTGITDFEALAASRGL